MAGNQDIPRGTAIATFNDSDFYPQDEETPKNSGIYLGAADTANGIIIFDQWFGHYAQARNLHPNHASPQQDSTAYSVNYGALRDQIKVR